MPVNRNTVNTLQNIAYEFQDQIEGNSKEALLGMYKSLLDVWNDMRTQYRPIGRRFANTDRVFSPKPELGERFLCPGDYAAVFGALDALHAMMMNRGGYNNGEVAGKLSALADFLNQGV